MRRQFGRKLIGEPPVCVQHLLWQRMERSNAPMQRVRATIALLLLTACSSVGSYSLECGQGVDRQVCEQVGAYGFASAEVAADSVHVQPASCSRYLDPSPADARCFTVRIIGNEGRTVVSIAQTGGELIGPLDLLPTDE